MLSTDRVWSFDQKAFYTITNQTDKKARSGDGVSSVWLDSRVDIQQDNGCIDGWTECKSSSSETYWQHILTGRCVWNRDETNIRPYLIEDHPDIAIERMKLNEYCLDDLVDANNDYGPMEGQSKTSRSCRESGMRIGLQGLYSRVVWTQSLEQVRNLGDIGFRKRDALFPLKVTADEAVVAELINAGRTPEAALSVYNILASSLESASKAIMSLESQRLMLDTDSIVTLSLEDSEYDISQDIEGSLLAENMLTITYRHQSFSIRGDHLLKLLHLYRLHTCVSASPNDALFLRRVFCVIARYETLSGVADGYQMAFPSSGFSWLRNKLGVSCECFASPLNVWNQEFCSVSYDTDQFFGSKGNFFCFAPSSAGGSFEANPPFVESVMEHMARRIEELLTMYKHSDIPLSFSVIVPGWDDAACVSHKIMSESEFLRPFHRYKLVLAAREHNYRPGMQQREARDEQNSNVSTFIFFLQNDAGSKKWPVTIDDVGELKAMLKDEAKREAVRIAGEKRHRFAS